MKKVMQLSIFIWMAFLMLATPVYSYYNAPYDNPGSYTNPGRIGQINDGVNGGLKTYSFVDDGTVTSDYGTHDWIADAALRLLYYSNPDDWNWLLHNPNDLRPDQTLQADPNYKGTDGNHNEVRSYIYFLLGTQWPDCEENPTKIPSLIRFPEEGEEFTQVSNIQGTTKAWMGRPTYQSYHYTVKMDGDLMLFIPKPTKASTNSPQKPPILAQEFGDIAAKFLGNNDGGISKSKPEIAAFYLGIMAHYIADVTVPAHLLLADDNIYFKEDGEYIAHSINYYYESSAQAAEFHKWYESSLAPFTYWNEYAGGPESDGPKLFSFDPDLTSIGKSSSDITKMLPEVATLAAAQESIASAFGEVSGWSYCDNNLNNEFRIQKGLFINEEYKSLLNTWSWGYETVSYDTKVISGKTYSGNYWYNGITYNEYYQKVQMLLSYAIYYTACAMKGVLEQAKKNNNDQDFDYNYWTDHPAEADANSQTTPIPDKTQEGTANADGDAQSAANDSIRMMGISLGILAPALALGLIAMALPMYKKK